MNPISGISPTANQKLLELLKIFPEINKVILFGSRALNTQKEGSDIDLALFGNNISFKTLRMGWPDTKIFTHYSKET